MKKQTYVIASSDSQTFINTYDDRIAKLQEKIDELTPKPRYSVGDEVLCNGYKKVRIDQVIVEVSKKIFSKAKFSFEYDVHYTQIDDVPVIRNGVREFRSLPSFGSFRVPESFLSEVPEYYETMLVHIISDLMRDAGTLSDYTPVRK